MAQTGFTPIQIYSSSTTGNTPAAGNLLNSSGGSEIAINIFDGKLFYKDNAGVVQVIGWKVVPVLAGGTGQTSYTDGQLLIGNSTGNTLTKATLTAGSGVSITNGAGAITISATGGTGTVTSITAGTGLTGGTITTSGTIAIDSTVATLTGTQTLTNKTLTAPKVDLINDTNGNEALVFSPTTSATDYFVMKNGIGVGAPIHIYADGSSANTGMHIQPKGTGLVTISDGTDFNKGIRFRSSGSAASAITLLDAVSTAGRVVTLPDATTTLVGRDTTDTLTNKSISGSTNTLSNIGNASLTNSAITINGVSTSLGGSIAVGTVTTVSGTGTVNGITLTGTVTSSGSLTLGGTLSGIGNSQLTNSTISGVALGGSLFNLTAGTGVSFSAGTTYNGSAAITINATGSGGTVTSVTGTAPVAVATGTTTPVISMAKATTSVDGYLSSTDWTTFNNKSNTNGTVTSVAALTLGTSGTDLSSTVANGTTTPVITLNVPTASAANRGALSAADWTTFNGKAPGVTFTTGYVPFGQGTTTLNQNANLFWDNTNARLGIATSSPTEKLTVNGGIVATGAATLSSGAGSYLYYTSGTSSAELTALNPGVAWLNQTYKALTHNWFTSGTERMRLFNSGGLSIGNTTDPGATNLSVTGSIGIGATSITSKLTVGNAGSTWNTFFQSTTATALITTGDGGANNTFVKVLGGVYNAANTINLDLIHAGKDNNIGDGWRLISGCGGGSGTNNSYLTFNTISTNGTVLTATERMRISAAGIVTMPAYGAGAATFSAAGVISSVSDETWKIKDGAPLNPDAMLQKLEPGYWFYNEEKAPIFGTDRQLGFYAQNVNEAIGEEAAPIPEEGKPWGYYDRSVLAVTVMSLQKALATIENLTLRIKALESK